MPFFRDSLKWHLFFIIGVIFCKIIEEKYIMLQVILASNSPRRKELLAEICPTFQTIPSDVDESVPSDMPPAKVVQTLAARKAKAVFDSLDGKENYIVIGSDTVVAYDGKILGKPATPAEAKKMLTLLSGNTHNVFTGVCIYSKCGAHTSYDRSDVTFNTLTEMQIDEYVATGSPMDKAGAYGIQDGGLVKRYEGSYTNIVGLPVELTKKMYNEVMDKL